MNPETILFLPSNANHVKIFKLISRILEQKSRILYLSQGLYKDEGAENELKSNDINFKKFDEYVKQNPEFVIDKENVCLIIIGNDTDVIPQWFTNVAYDMNIPTILIQDGLLFDVKPTNNSFSYRLNSLMKNPSKKLLKLALQLKLSKQFKKISYGQSNCTQIHVWGKSAEKFLLNRNVSKNKIKISGNPKYHKINNTSPQKIHNNQKEILFAPTDLIHTGILPKEKVHEFSNDLCSSITELEHVNLIIKPHPIENPNFYKPFLEKFGDKVTISTSDINELIDNADIIITNLSTVSVEALQKNKPVIIFLPEIDNIITKDSFPRDLIEKQVFYFASNKKELLEHITNILNNKTTSKSLIDVSDYIVNNGDEALTNITDSIMEILEK